MQEQLVINKKEKDALLEATLEGKLEKPEEIQESPEQVMENDIENISGNIEFQSEKFEKNQGKLNELLQGMSPEEGEFIREQVESTEEGQSILARIKEKSQALANAYHHTEEKLSEKYHPKLVKAVGSVGKALGGLSGMLAGHGVLSAAGAVVGAKTGGYAMLKTFESMAKYLPSSVQEKILKKENEAEKMNMINEIKEREASINEKLKTREKLKEELDGISGEIESLPENDKMKFMESLEGDEKTISATEGLKETYKKYSNFYKDFEKKYPLLATGAEVAVHAVIGPMLHGMEVGKQALHAIELLAAAGGAEKLTAHLTNIAGSIREGLAAAKEKLSRLTQRAEEPAVA